MFHRIEALLNDESIGTTNRHGKQHRVDPNSTAESRKLLLLCRLFSVAFDGTNKSSIISDNLKRCIHEIDDILTEVEKLLSKEGKLNPEKS